MKTVPAAVLILCSFAAGAAEATAQATAQDVDDYLWSLASRLTTQRQPPALLSTWENGRAALHRNYMEIIGLDPLPTRTPLNPFFVGSRVDLGDCYFQRVVFESRPRNYVACHLYTPKNVTYPVPAIMYVPGHGLPPRDPYNPHPHTYAANGCVALALPQLGDEGKRGGAYPEPSTSTRPNYWCHKGPLLGRFEWFNTGYCGAAPEVWDTMRAVDYLLSLTVGDVTGTTNSTRAVKVSPDGQPQIGLAGRSGGCARALWAAAADSRIAVVVGAQGFQAIWNSRHVVRGCDVHLFYNYYGLEFAELFSLIAPRPLLVQHGTLDSLYPNPQPVADFLTTIYGLYGQPDRFRYAVYNQGHGDTDALKTDEYTWLNRWLRGVNAPMAAKGWVSTNMRCFPANGPGLIPIPQYPYTIWAPADVVSTMQQYTPPTPSWTIGNQAQFDAFKATLMGHLQSKIIRTAFADAPAQLTTVGTRENYTGYWLEEKRLLVDGGLSHKGYFFCKPGAARKTVVLLSGAALDKTTLQTLYVSDYLAPGLNLLCIEPSGIGGTAWGTGTYDGQPVDVYVRRLAMLVGHTVSSLRVNDALAAVKALSTIPEVDPNGIYVRGNGGMAVPAIYAAAANPNVAGVVLEDAPDHHTAGTALFLILKHADIPQAAALLFPRRIVLAGQISANFNWTEGIYGLLGASREFIRHSGTPASLGWKLGARPTVVSGPAASPNPVTLPGTAALGVVASDPDSGPQPLTYSWSKVSGPGTASFTPNGSATAGQTTAAFTAAGTYVLRVTVSDGALVAGGEVNLTVNPDPNVALVYTFDADAQGWAYADDVFRGTTGNAVREDGKWDAQGGSPGGGVRVDLGGPSPVDTSSSEGTPLSGGWSRTFMTNAGDLIITLDYRLTMNGTLDPGEYAEVLVSVDGELVGLGANDHLLRRDGNAAAQDTGWVVNVQVRKPGLAAGTHTVGLGAYLRHKTGVDENVRLFLDNVEVESASFIAALDHVSTGKAYAFATAQVGILPYIDRSYTVTSLSASLEGGFLIRQANDDKYVTASEHLKFSVSAPAHVYVCYDKRVATLPAWLNDGSWTLTALTLSVTDVWASPMLVYAKSVPAGQVTLGGNSEAPASFPGGSGRSNYIVVVKPAP